jgi:hypothetical protein
LHAAHAEGPDQYSGGWLSWIYGQQITSNGAATAPESTGTEQLVVEPQTTKSTELQSAVKDATAGGEETEQEPEQTNDTIEVTPAAQKRSWLQMWYGSNAPSKQEGPSASEPTVSSTNAECPETTDISMTPKDPPDEAREPSSGAQNPVGTTRSSGWSFWSKDPTKDGHSDKPQEGEAVEASIESQTPYKPTTLEPDAETNVKITQKGSIKVKPPKDNRAKDGSMTAIEASSAQAQPVEPRPADATASKQLQKILPNQVLPRFEETYTFEESPSLFQSLGRFLHYGKGPELKHVSRIRDPLHVKRALAIGVHGYFPAPFIRSVLGQPTGTSIRFSNMAADAIRKYTESRGYSCNIEKVALEGEGRITERVDLLWKLLLNWMEEIRKADFIMVACHSQGVPVAIMLVAKLVQFGCLDAKRVGICAMAGVNLGPFPDYRSRWISGSAGELFEFALPFSKVSKEYEAALKCALDFGVRISYIGSIDDQLVSLEVCTFLTSI